MLIQLRIPLPRKRLSWLANLLQPTVRISHAVPNCSMCNPTDFFQAMTLSDGTRFFCTLDVGLPFIEIRPDDVDDCSRYHDPGKEPKIIGTN